MTSTEQHYQEQRFYFVKQLLQWYNTYKRDLPWRENKDPYRIWVSEIMLQQTRVDTVIPYYERFMKRFPTIDDLAEAPEDEVIKLWEGLGYYSRARNLQHAVREVKESYGGVVPDSPEEISTLKGIGPYTAGAILSIAYGKPEPAVDGNVMRVLSRYFLITEDITKGSTRAQMEALIRMMIPHDAAGDFNQALMELGALICTPKSPQCLICPVMEHCTGRLEGMETELPVKKKAKPPRPERRLVALVALKQGDQDKVLVRRRPAQGLLANMWELPHCLVPANQTGASEQWDKDLLQADLYRNGIHAVPERSFMRVDHTFSHIYWDMEVYTCTVDATQQEQEAPEGYLWMEASEMESMAFPNVFLRILARYYEEKPN